MLDRLHEVSPAVAARVDARLVELAGRLPLPPTLAEVRQQIPRGSHLLFLECGREHGEQRFDIYLDRGPAHRLCYLNPLLAATGLLPTEVVQEARRVVVPFAASVRGAMLLAQTLATRLWGEQAEEPAYPFDLDFS